MIRADVKAFLSGRYTGFPTDETVVTWLTGLVEDIEELESLVQELKDERDDQARWAESEIRRLEDELYEGEH